MSATPTALKVSQDVFAFLGIDYVPEHAEACTAYAIEKLEKFEKDNAVKVFFTDAHRGSGTGK